MPMTERTVQQPAATSISISISERYRAEDESMNAPSGVPTTGRRAMASIGGERPTAESTRLDLVR